VSQTPEQLEARIAEIKARYQPEIDRLTEDGRRLAEEMDQPNAGEAVINVDFDVSWRDRQIAFDIPQFSMGEKRLVLDRPVVSAKREQIIFHTPSTRMVAKKIGQYPEFHGFRVKWKDLIAHVPEVFMERQEIIYDLPTVRMERKEIVLSVPEASMGRVEWVLRLPEVTMKSVSAEVRRVKERGETLKAQGESLAERMRGEVELLVAGFQAELMASALGAKEQVVSSYNGAIGAVTRAVQDLQAKGVDPIKVPTATGDVNLRKDLDSLIRDRDRAVADLDSAAPALPLAA
jgi:hypothetical protein